MVLPDGARDRRPCALEDQDTLDVVALELLMNVAMVRSYNDRRSKPSYLAGDGVEQGSLDTEERHGGGTRLCLNSARERRDDDGACLGLEEGVDDGGLLASHVVVQPVPRLAVDGFTDGADDAEGAEVGVLDVGFTETAEEADGGGGGVEVRELVLVDRLPEAGGGGVHGGGFEHGGGDTVREGPVDEVAEVM